MNSNSPQFSVHTVPTNPGQPPISEKKSTTYTASAEMLSWSGFWHGFFLRFLCVIRSVCWHDVQEPVVTGWLCLPGRELAWENENGVSKVVWSIKLVFLCLCLILLLGLRMSAPVWMDYPKSMSSSRPLPMAGCVIRVRVVLFGAQPKANTAVGIICKAWSFFI